MGKASHRNQNQIDENPNPNPNPNPNSQFTSIPNRRTRSNRNFIPILPPDFIHGFDFVDSDDSDDNDENENENDERVLKKVKLISNQVENGTKVTDTHNGTSKIVGPTSCTAAKAGAGGVSNNTALPDRKLLFLIIDKLKKKDTRGVFAEPVDPEELPDYHEIIENPMDFGTVKKKLDGSRYSTLEQFEADIYLICSNAMQYNTPSSMFFRQARAIQELAKKEFETLRQEGGNSEVPSKPRRGRPPGSRNLKKLLESSSVERNSVPESSPDATPASNDDDTAKSSSYNLRKGPSLYRFPRNLDFCFNSPASASKSTSAKYVKKQYESEESRRETYNPSGQFDSGQDPSLLATFETSENGLIPVGLGSTNHSYARSLALFGADLGPVVWSIVSNKIRSVLPRGVEFGPGWIAENKALSSVQFSSPMEKTDSISRDSSMNKLHYPLNPGFSSSTNVFDVNSFEARGSSSSSEWCSIKGVNGVVGNGSPYHIQRDPVVDSSMMNGLCGLGNGLPIHGAMNVENEPNTRGLPYWQCLSMQERWDNASTTGEPMVGFQASSSRSSVMPIGSPPQLDLVLQL